LAAAGSSLPRSRLPIVATMIFIDMTVAGSSGGVMLGRIAQAPA